MSIQVNNAFFIIIDLSVWHQKHEECNRICTIKSQNVSCSNRDKAVISRFQFDINLPVNVFRAGKCKSCFNVTHITITCKLNQTSMKSEPKTTQNGEIFTAEMKSKSSGKCFLCLCAYLFCILSKNVRHVPYSFVAMK